MRALQCPHCRSPLQPFRQGDLRGWRCPQQHGETMAVTLVRRLAAGDTFKALWSSVLKTTEPSGPPCVCCARPMATATAGGQELDACRSCQMVWFDHGEQTQLQREGAAQARENPAPVDKPLPPEAARLLAQAQIEQIRGEYEDANVVSAASGWQGYAAWLGLPVELDEPSKRGQPAMTITLAVLLFIGSAAFVTDDWVNLFGLHDTLAANRFLMGFVTHAFVPGSILQLLLSLYALLVLADNVEDDLGHAAFIGLWVGASVVGGALQLALGNDMLLGAIGPISAVVGYYAVRWPNARFGLLMWSRWSSDHLNLRFGGYVMLTGWVALTALLGAVGLFDVLVSPLVPVGCAVLGGLLAAKVRRDGSGPHD